MIVTICAIISALAAIGGLAWRFLWKKGANHEAIEADIDSKLYDDLDDYDRM